MLHCRKSLAALVIAMTAAGVAPAFAATASPVGQWLVTTGEARYAVSSCGGGLCAKLVWLRSDVRNGQNLSLLNQYIVKGAQPQGDGVWSADFSIDGNSYTGTVTMVSKNFMRLRACAGFLCQVYEFTRL